NHSIPELPVCLRIGNGDLAITEPHQPRTFERRQSTRVLSAALFDEDLRSVLEVSSAQRSANSVEIRQAIAEAVAFRFVALSVISQVVPQMIGERVSRSGGRLQNVEQLWRRPARRNRKIKGWVLAENALVETDNVYALTMLRHPISGINNLVEHLVIQWCGC